MAYFGTKFVKHYVGGGGGVPPALSSPGEVLAQKACVWYFDCLKRLVNGKVSGHVLYELCEERSRHICYIVTYICLIVVTMRILI
jgi:hypothetical protein